MAVAEKCDLEKQLSRAQNELNEAGEVALAKAEEKVIESQALVVDATMSNAADRALLQSEVKKLRRQLHAACMKFRVDRQMFEKREVEAANQLEQYKEEFSRRVNELETSVEDLQSHL